MGHLLLSDGISEDRWDICCCLMEYQKTDGDIAVV